MVYSWGPLSSMRHGRSWVWAPGPADMLRTLCFLHSPFLPPSGDSFFRTFPTKPVKVLGLLYTTGWVYYNPNTMKSYKNYLQNTQHVVFHNRPTLSIGTERLACLNNPHGMQLGPSSSTRQIPGSRPGRGGSAARAFFLHPPFLPPTGVSFFRTFPTKPVKVLGLLYPTGWVYYNWMIAEWFCTQFSSFHPGIPCQVSSEILMLTPVVFMVWT